MISKRGAGREFPILMARTLTIQILTVSASFNLSTALTCSSRALSTIQMP